MPEEKQPLIVLAEDDNFLIKAYQVKLEKSGYKIVVAHDGEEALEKLKSIKPDLLLLDIIMPKKSGFEVLEAMRGNPSLKKIPVVIMSNLGQEADMKQGMDLGAKAYFVKADTSLHDIVGIVKKYLHA